MQSKIDELFKRLEAEGKLTTLTQDEANAIMRNMLKDMEATRHDLARKAAQSKDDLKKIILNA